MKALALALFVWFLASLAYACAPAVSPDPARPDSVVALLGVAHAAPCIGFPEDPCRAADRYVPTCAAFAIVHDQQTQLVTASHCVPEDARELRFYAPSGWGHGRAYLLERRDDVALLSPADADALAPLRVGHLPLVGDAVQSAGSAGRVEAWLGAVAFEASLTVPPGGSGSPVFDERGEVVGVVSRCHAAMGVCLAGHTVVAALPRGSF